ncbi:MAG: hypothetical protein ACFFCM_01270 [Promethearchaeota archaeon]
MAGEIPKPLKIIWLLNLIPCIIWGIIYFFFIESIYMTDITVQFNAAAATTGRSVGLLLFLFAIFLIRMYLLDDWSKIQFYVEFCLIWIAYSIVIDIWALIALSTSPSGFVITLLGTIVLIVLEIPYIYYWLQLKE